MKLSDIVKQLQNNLPLNTTLFSNTISVSNLTLAGTTVTATTATAHGLAVGNNVVINGATTPNPITSLTQSNGLGRLVTNYNHDITKNTPFNKGDSTHITITGANESDYNGTFLIMNIPNSNVIEFSITETAPATATGLPVLEEDIRKFYNGRQVVTAVPSTTTFEYTITDIPLATTAGGTITVNTGARISGDKSLEHAIRAYTKQPHNALWGFAIFDGSEVSKQRVNQSDSLANFRAGNDLSQRDINNFSFYVFIPSSQTNECPIDEVDTALELLPAILKSLHLAKFDTGLNDGNTNLAYIGNNFAGEAEGDAFIIWQYRFQSEVWTGNTDGVDPDYATAFRHFEFTGTFEENTGEIITEGDLPDEKVT